MSDRGAGVLFGPDITENFCAVNGVSLVIRSHECMQEGFAVRTLLMLFPASSPSPSLVVEQLSQIGVCLPFTCAPVPSRPPLCYCIFGVPVLPSRHQQGRIHHFRVRFHAHAAAVHRGQVRCGFGCRCRCPCPCQCRLDVWMMAVWTPHRLSRPWSRP
jgi:hypothetical protein